MNKEKVKGLCKDAWESTKEWWGKNKGKVGLIAGIIIGIWAEHAATKDYQKYFLDGAATVEREENPETLAWRTYNEEDGSPMLAVSDSSWCVHRLDGTGEKYNLDIEATVPLDDKTKEWLLGNYYDI